MYRLESDCPAPFVKTGSFITPMVVGPVNTATMGNSFNVGPLDPDIYTIQFSLLGLQISSRSATFPAVPNLLATVNWKVGGQQQRRVISVGEGTVISAVCEAVDVQLTDLGETTSIVAGTPYKVQATLAKGCRADTMQPPTLLQGGSVQVVTSGLKATFAVPNDAGVISAFPFIAPQVVVAGTLAQFNVIATMTDGSGSTILAPFMPLFTPGWVPVPAGTAQISFLHNYAANLLISVLWGVEG